MSAATLDLEALLSFRSSTGQALLLDVSPADVFAAGHLPGALNACVYEMDFLDQVMALIPDRNTPVVVYGSRARSLASASAAEKLEHAGYTNVNDYREGLDGWRAAGRDTEGVPAVDEVPVPPSGTFTLNTTKSRLGWVGRNVASLHHGEIGLKEGASHIDDGMLVTGDIVVDMQKIICLDLTDTAMNRMLIKHLESDDFFDVARFPEAAVTVIGSRVLPEATPGTPNLELECVLSLKGKSEKFTFTAVSGFQADGGWVAQAHFDLDRTLWNVLYGSGKFFDHLGMHLVNDMVSFQLLLVADRDAPGVAL